MTKSLLSAMALMLILARPAVSQECRPISYTACGPTGVVHYYDPDTGEICPGLDCGGGRAPPKTNVPGCPLYTGTDLPKTEKSYLECWTGFSTSSSATTTAVSTTTTVSSSLESVPSSATVSSSLESVPSSATVSSSLDSVPSSAGSGDSITISTTKAGASPPETTEPPLASKPPASGAESSSRLVSTPNAGNVVGGSSPLMAVVVGAAFGVLL